MKTYQNSTKKTAAILIALSLTFFTISCREGETGMMHSMKNATQFTMRPVQIIGNVICSPFSGIGNIASNLTASQKTLSELEEENKLLIARNAELEEQLQANARLQGLLQIRGTYDLKTLGAKIISAPQSSWADVVTIDVGSDAGLAVGMPAMDTYGVIGQISSVSPTSSQVRLMTDESSRISAMVQKNRVQGVLRGSANGTVKLTLVPIDTDVAIGDLIVTSGLGGIYPKGMPLGKVSSVEKPEGALYCTIVVEPISNVHRVEELLVITSLTEAQMPTSEEIAAADKLGAYPEDKKDKKKDGESGSDSGQDEANQNTNSQEENR